MDPEGLLWTGWSEWYGCAGQTFYERSELCAFPERRKLKSYSQGYSRLIEWISEKGIGKLHHCELTPFYSGGSIILTDNVPSLAREQG